MNNEKIEQIEQVEQDNEELDLDVKRVKSLKTDVKAGLADRTIDRDIIRTNIELSGSPPGISTPGARFVTDGTSAGLLSDIPSSR